jgi:solute:Na+ symporter, SSS family
MNGLPAIDIAVLLVYLAGTVALGLWVGRKSRSTEEFMAAGRKVPGWAVGLSIFGTYVSSISFLALPGKAYATNWNAFAFSLALPLTTWMAVKWFVPFYRRERALSSYEHLERRFGPWARTYAVLCYLLTQLARMGTIMYLLALALAPLTGWSVPWLIVLTGAAVIVYTLVGGMEAVIWTDVMQSLVFIIGALACVAALFLGLPHGPGQLFDLAAAHHKFSLGSFGPALNEPTFWVVLVYGLFINLQNFGIDQSYVQRYQTAKTDPEAVRSVWLGAMLYLPISAVFFFIGTGLFAFYAARPELLPAAVAAKPDQVFPHFIVAQLPVGLTGLVIAAIFAAAQSTISSSINCSATLVLCDLYRRYFRPAASERESMRVLWAASLFFGLAGTGVALAMMRIRSALDAWWELAGIFSGGMLGLFLLGLISRRAKNAAAVTGVVLGVLVILWMTLSPKWTGPLAPLRSPFHQFMVIVIGTLTILLVGLLISRLSGTESRPERPGPGAPGG